jgi:hypothetical protein
MPCYGGNVSASYVGGCGLDHRSTPKQTTQKSESESEGERKHCKVNEEFELKTGLGNYP